MGQEEEDSGNISYPKHYTFGYLTQHIHFTEPTVLEEAVLGLRPEDRDSVYKVETILFGLGFDDEKLALSPHELSGGFQLRLNLAKVLAGEPDCLLLDEPTNYLDIVSIQWLEKFLKEWKREFLIISHDRDFLDSVTTHTIAVHRNKIRKVVGGTEEMFTQIFESEILHEKTRQKLETKRAHLENYVRRFGAKASKATQAQSKVKAMQRLPVLDQLAQLEDLDFRFTPSPFPGKRILAAENLSFSYDDSTLIHDLNLTIDINDRIAVVGKNGRGKSTILKLLTGELTPHTGTIKTSPNMQTAYFGQTNIDRLDVKLTIEEEIGEANHKLSFTQVRAICGTMLFDGDKAKKTISILSGGERSRVLLGKILATPCNMLFLDEPTHHLDIESIESLMSAIDDFPGAVIIVTHSELILHTLPLTKLVICGDGKQEVMEGNYQDFLDKGGWSRDDKKPAPKVVEKKSATPSLKEQLLKPLKEKVNTLEKKIVEAESALESATKNLTEASNTQDHKKIGNLSRDVARLQKEIDSLFLKLEEASKAYEAAKLE
jgi:ATP-binding cassette subfamily F protein 3